MIAGKTRVRFAPSPTGSLHLGNARTALFNWLVARRSGGTFVLRIEDTDTARGMSGSEEAILEDLAWLGLGWDEGPDVGGPYGPYRQSERSSWYEAAARRLLETGRAYRCFCRGDDRDGEREVRPAEGRAGGYPGTCREVPEAESRARAAAGEPFALRFRTVPRNPGPDDLTVRFRDRLRGPLEFPALELGDAVLIRSDGRPTYNFAVVVDDIAMAITLVLRGDDHLSNTPRQVLLFRALAAEPPDFAHLPMVRGPDGERLSKRHGATSVAEYRARGFLPEGLLNALALLGWAPSKDRTIVTIDEMLEEFDLDRVNRSAAIFDPMKLDWVAGQHFHRAPLGRLLPGIVERLIAKGWLPPDRRPEEAPWLEAVGALAQNAVETLDQAAARVEAVFLPRGVPATEEERRTLDTPEARRVLDALLRLLSEGEPTDAAAWTALTERLKADTGLKGRVLFQAIRVALTGETSGPELDRLVPLMVAGNAVHPDRVPSLAERVRRALEAIR